jgi:hypothetical protein
VVVGVLGGSVSAGSRTAAATERKRSTADAALGPAECGNGDFPGKVYAYCKQMRGAMSYRWNITLDAYKGFEAAVRVESTSAVDPETDDVRVEVKFRQISNFDSGTDQMMRRLRDLPWVLSANFQTRTFKYGPQKGDLIGVQTGQCLIDLDGFAHSVLDLHSVDREWRTDIYARDSLRRWFRGQSIAESVIGFSHTTIDPETFWLIPVLWVRITRNELAMYDAFISHAFEDKALARPLAHGLSEKGFRIWYDEFELKVGDSLVESINRGLVNSRYGIVVLSHAFFAKRWPRRELVGFTTLQLQEGTRAILPVWYNITKAEIAAIDPALADTVAIICDGSDVDGVAMRLAEVLRVNRSASGTLRPR